MKTLIAGVALLLSLAPHASAAKNPFVVMTIAGRGKVTIELYPAKAPQTVAHFRKLVKSGFYNGILIHRVDPGFVIQAGDPQTKTGGVDAPGVGTGGSGRNIPFEENDLKHLPGTMAMALSAPHSATGDSQWFINLARNASLDVDYCVFGKVAKGMDVVRRIRKGDKIANITESKPSVKK